MPFTGGHEITSLEWIDGQSILARFTSTYTRETYQLYAGRTKIGEVSDPNARSIVGQLSPSHYPQVITLLAVSAAEQGQDLGGTLPPRPYNKGQLVLGSSGVSADTKYLDIYLATVDQGPVDLTNRVARLNHAGQQSHTWVSDPLGPSGDYALEVHLTDDKPAAGNSAYAFENSFVILTHPPDVTPDAADNRFTLALTAGALTATATLPPDLAA